jgi:hypothetical protein
MRGGGIEGSRNGEYILSSRRRLVIIMISNNTEIYRFFRNTLGYIDDCVKAKVSPSPFQLCLFLYEADMPIAVSPGPEWIAKWSDWAFTLFMGKCVGQWVLGYQGTYAEYFQGPSDSM